MVAPNCRQAPPYRLTRGTHRMLIFIITVIENLWPSEVLQMVHMGRVPAAQARGCHGLSVGGLFVGLNDFMDARKARLDDILQDIGTKTLKYLYDFGDGWEHTIKIERLVDPKPGMLYPSLIEAKGHCPPEDVGGPGAIANSSRPSPILTTGATASSKNGSQTTSILMSSMSISCPKTSPIWLSNGRADPLSSAAVPPDPRYSPDAYTMRPSTGSPIPPCASR